MFAEDFSTNDIWKHFRAVQDKKVYQLDYQLFGMSCTFDWPEALEVLNEILYEGTYSAYDAEAAYAKNGGGSDGGFSGTQDENTGGSAADGSAGSSNS